MRNESYILERRARVLGLWMRLRAALRAEARRPPRGHPAWDAYALAKAIGEMLDEHWPPGFAFRNAIEAADVGADDRFEPAPAGEPCRAAPGSGEKLAAIHARAQAGRDLWHPLDGPDN